ncbi:MAG: hypothetical protein HY929_00370 [Euryarchaeota archaeon]|nr:hypothetical protein [Euryarchaeota archaeon]
MNKFDPRRREDRLKALGLKYTSNSGECPLYDTSLNSKCKLDPDTYRLYDCRGIWIIDGICCRFLVGARERLVEKANQTLLLSLFGVSVLLGYNSIAVMVGIFMMLYGYNHYRVRQKTGSKFSFASKI